MHVCSEQDHTPPEPLRWEQKPCSHFEHQEAVGHKFAGHHFLDQRYHHLDLPGKLPLLFHQDPSVCTDYSSHMHNDLEIAGRKDFVRLDHLVQTAQFLAYNTLLHNTSALLLHHQIDLYTLSHLNYHQTTLLHTACNSYSQPNSHFDW